MSTKSLLKNVLCLIAHILSFCTDASLDWSTSTTPIPRADSIMAIGHSSANVIYLFGGINNQHQLVSFDPTHLDGPSPFIDDAINGLPHDVRFSGKGYTQIEDTVYMIDPTGNKFNIFNISSSQFIYNFNNIIIPQNVYIRSCLAHIDHYLIVTGGWDSQCLSNVQIFDLNSQKWILTANNMIHKLSNHGCVVNPQNKYLYVIGGRFSADDADNLDTISKLYVGDIDHIVQYNWIDLEDTLRTPRTGCRTVIHKGDIFVIGGKDPHSKVTADVDIILSNDTVIADNDLPIAVAYPSTIITNNTLFVIGGTLQYDPSTIKSDSIQYTILSSEPNDYLFRSTSSEIASISSTDYMFTSQSISAPISETKPTSITSDSTPFTSDSTPFTSTLSLTEEIATFHSTHPFTKIPSISSTDYIFTPDSIPFTSTLTNDQKQAKVEETNVMYLTDSMQDEVGTETISEKQTIFVIVLVIIFAITLLLLIAVIVFCHRFCNKKKQYEESGDNIHTVNEQEMKVDIDQMDNVDKMNAHLQLAQSTKPVAMEHRKDNVSKTDDSMESLYDNYNNIVDETIRGDTTKAVTDHGDVVERVDGEESVEIVEEINEGDFSSIKYQTNAQSTHGAMLRDKILLGIISTKK